MPGRVVSRWRHAGGDLLGQEDTLETGRPCSLLELEDPFGMGGVCQSPECKKHEHQAFTAEAAG